MIDTLLTTRQVAKLVGLSPETILRRYRAGELRGVRLGSNVLRFRESDVEAWLEAPREPVTRAPLNNWRAREWRPALESAGLAKRRIYDMRHSFATWGLDAGLSIFELSRYMGSSVEMIDRTYGHLAKGAEVSARSKMDAYATRTGQRVDRFVEGTD